MTDPEKALEALEKAIKAAVLSESERQSLSLLHPHAERLARIARTYDGVILLGDALKWAAGIAAAVAAAWTLFWRE